MSQQQNQNQNLPAVSQSLPQQTVSEADVKPFSISNIGGCIDSNIDSSNNRPKRISRRPNYLKEYVQA
ncbi:hypothetical protein D0Y65_028480 [Glycine soja]|uniref:Uncharacterized protein n=1 Tax=Glycine soja TaxID=3848 RepID=A0A445IUF5_GLYSO|nr:hypothetical protein D0Y65_028480 [Glycine soja]RZB89727.1 hypothetical protein D0Y65_028480 [Glycine soja]